MTDESLPRGYAVLMPVVKPSMPDAGRAWASLSALAACISFWTVILLIVW